MSLGARAVWIYYKELFLPELGKIPEPTDIALSSRGNLHCMWDSERVLMIIRDSGEKVFLCGKEYELDQEVFIRLRELILLNQK